MSTDRIWGAGTSSSTRRIGFREWYHCDKSVIADLFPPILRSVARDDTNIICVQCHSWWGGGLAGLGFPPKSLLLQYSRVKKYTNSAFEALQEIFSC